MTVKILFIKAKLLICNFAEISAMEIQIRLNPNLYLKDPEQSELGRNIIKHSIEMIHDVGFESFTFKKLAANINTTEASVYRYFENKHRLLSYIINWYWTWMEYQFNFYTNTVKNPVQNINTLISLLVFELDDQFISAHINKDKLYNIVTSESNKLYFTHHVEEDNKARMFKPYKDLCHRISQVFNTYNAKYRFAHSLASTLVETAHHQIFFAHYLPSLTDFDKRKIKTELKAFLSHMAFSMLDGKK